MRRFFSLILSLLISFPVYADVVSLDANYVAGQTDMVTKLNNDRTSLQDGVNNISGVFSGSPQTSGQVKADTIGEENMADDANPRIRTNEGASCADLVVSGLLPATTVGTLVGSIPSGKAYPDGYRIDKTSSTPKTFTASKWTYIDLDINGTFQYSEVNIDASVPSVAANSARLARVSTDGTQIVAVQDLRTTSCTAGPFSAISDTSTGATLADIFSKGAPVRQFSHAGATPSGYIQGMFVSYDTHTTFLVTSGSAYINGEYRYISEDTTVPTTTDDPSTGVSGIDTGSAATESKHYVFAVADQESVPTASVTWSQSATPSGLTNYRLIGSITTDASGLFTSNDVTTAHAVNSNEIIGAWVHFDGTGGSPTITDSYNISAVANQSTGDNQVTFDTDFRGSGGDENFACVCSSLLDCVISGQAPGTCRVITDDRGGATATDTSRISVIAIGDQVQ